MSNIDLFQALEQLALYRKGVVPDIQKNLPELKKMSDGYRKLAEEAALPRCREAIIAASEAVARATEALQKFMEVATDEGRVIGEHLRTIACTTEDIDRARQARTAKEREAAEKTEVARQVRIGYIFTTTGTTTTGTS